jgi:hypothetical protein
MSELLPRAVLSLVAIVLIGWFAVLVRNNHIAQEAARRLHENPEMSDAAWARQLDQLRKAELLDPDLEWRVTRANYILLRDKDAALRVAESVLRREPDNLNAWEVVLLATRGRDTERSSQARAEVRRLNPVPRGG